MSAHEMVGKVVLNNYLIEEYIGSGGFGDVYKASQARGNEKIYSAIKKIQIPSEKDYHVRLASMGNDIESTNLYFKDVLTDITNEIMVMHQLAGKSTNIVAYFQHDIIEYKNPLRYEIFIAIEYLTPLDKYFSKNEMTLGNVLQMGIDIASALDICHTKRIVHRDIKEGNIFINEDGVYKLGDFGMAKKLTESSKAADQTGTLIYMAPEITVPFSKYDKTVDLYSLGIVLFKMLNNGRFPFLPDYPIRYKPTDEENALMRRFQGEELPKPQYATSEVADFIRKACQKNPSDRYQTAKEFSIELSNILNKLDETCKNSKVTAMNQESQSLSSNQFIEESLRANNLSFGKVYAEEYSNQDIWSSFNEKANSVQSITPNSSKPTDSSRTGVESSNLSSSTVIKQNVELKNTEKHSKVLSKLKRTALIFASLALLLSISVYAAIGMGKNLNSQSYEASTTVSGQTYAGDNDSTNANQVKNEQTDGKTSDLADSTLNAQSSDSPIMINSENETLPENGAELSNESSVNSNDSTMVVSDSNSSNDVNANKENVSNSSSTIITVPKTTVPTTTTPTTTPVTTTPTPTKVTPVVEKQEVIPVWSNWNTILPTGVTEATHKIETKKQYRFSTLVETTSGWSDWGSYDPSGVNRTVEKRYQIRSKVYTTNTASTLAGWFQNGSPTITYGEWSSWSTNAATASDTLEVQSKDVGVMTYRTVYNYSSWKYVNGTTYYSYTSGYGGFPGTWLYKTTDYPLTQTGTYSGHPGYYTDGVFWFNQSTSEVEAGLAYHKEYQTRTKTSTYNYWTWGEWTPWESGNYSGNTSETEVNNQYRYQEKTAFWSDWSQWSENAQESSDKVRVEAQTLYRYVTN